MLRELKRLLGRDRGELERAVPFLGRVIRAVERDETGELYEDSVAALPSVLYRLLFFPPGTRLRVFPPLLWRAFTPRRLSVPSDGREAAVRACANGWRFRAEYRWTSSVLTAALGFLDFAVWPAPWVASELLARFAVVAPPGIPYPAADDDAAARERAAEAVPRAKLQGRRVVVKEVGTGTVYEAAGSAWRSADLALQLDSGASRPLDPTSDRFVLVTPQEALWQGRYVVLAAAAAAFLAPPTAHHARKWALVFAAVHSVARTVPRAYRKWVDDVLDKSTDDPGEALKDVIRNGVDFVVIGQSDTADFDTAAS